MYPLPLEYDRDREVGSSRGLSSSSKTVPVEYVRFLVVGGGATGATGAVPTPDLCCNFGVAVAIFSLE